MRVNRKLMTAVSALAVCALSQTAMAETFKMQTFLGANAATTLAFEKMAAELKEKTGGEVEIEVLPSGAVVGVPETLDAVQGGILDGHYTAATYFAGKDPAMGVLGDTLAAYPDSETRNRWFDEGGGRELATTLFDGYGLHYICNVYWPVEQIPSTKPIETVADFQGLRMRAPGGLASDLLTKAGASLVTMGVGDSVTAMETGALDATDLANIALNQSLGMYEKAKFSVLARHSMATTDVSVSKPKWDALSPESQQAFTEACEAMSQELATSLQAADKEASDTLSAAGVTLIEFGEEDQKAFRDITLQVWDEWGAKSAEAQAIVDSHKAFLAELGLL